MIDEEHIKERIDYYIENKFYYIKYPDGVDEGFWNDRNGKYVPISDMGFDHLRACIRLIEKDIRWYDNEKLKDVTHNSVREAIIPLAEIKLAELKEKFKYQANKI